MLKQGASSHNLALRETRRQREEVPLPEGPVNLGNFKDEDEKKEDHPRRKEDPLICYKYADLHGF